MQSLGNFPDPFFAEIAGQPDALRRAAAALVDQRDALDRVREAAESARTLVFTGMGSSYDACYPAVNDLAGRHRVPGPRARLGGLDRSDPASRVAAGGTARPHARRIHARVEGDDA